MTHGITSVSKDIVCSIWNTAVVRTGIIINSIRIARSHGLKMTGIIQQWNRILILLTVNVLSGPRASNASISHGAIQMMDHQRNPGNEFTRGYVNRSVLQNTSVTRSPTIYLKEIFR